MNLLFFLIPKSQVAYVFSTSTVRQVAEKLSYYKYTAIPVLDDKGKYVATISEGDLLWFIKDNAKLSYLSLENISISDVPPTRKIKAITSNESMENLYSLAMEENFVPVVDDQEVFIGIITRKTIMKYFLEKENKEQLSKN